MDTYATAMPVRTLSPDQKAAIAYFYKPQGGVLVFFIFFLPLLFGLLVGGGNDNVLAGLGGAVVVIGLLLWLRRWNGRRKMTRAEFIYEYGNPETITFVGLGANYSFKVNGQPQPVINLLRGSEPLKIKTFDDRIITAFMHPQQVVYVHAKYPDVLVPSGLFALDRAPQACAARSVGV